jgi:hypothetical protein
MENDFANFCKKYSVFDFWKKNDIKPVIVGGYGIKLALDNTKNIINKKDYENISNTKDLDIHFNLKDSIYAKKKLNSLRVVTSFMTKIIKAYALEKKINMNRFKFVPPVQIEKGFKTKRVTGLRFTPAKVGDIKLYYIFAITLDMKPFLDITITNEPYRDLSNKLILDRQGLINTGMPIKTIPAYIEEMIAVSLRELIPNKYREYKKRNPIVGFNKNKGKKDSTRLKVLCSVLNFKQFSYLKSPCILLKMIGHLIKNSPQLSSLNAKKLLNKYSQMIKKNMTNRVQALV